MTLETPIDNAHAAMLGDEEDANLRLQFYDRLAHSELFVLLQSEPEDGEDNITPEVFELDGTQFILVFDREERLAQFVGKTAPYAALSGRVIAQMLAGQGIGLGLNLEVAPSSILLPPGAMEWLHDTLDRDADEVSARVAEVMVPKGLPETLIATLDTRLASAMGLARCAYLAGVRYDTGAQGHMLAFVDAMPPAQGALTQLASGALTFSGIEAGAIDVAFVTSDAPVVERLERVGLRFDVPQPEDGATPRAAPGSDPEKPPILK